MCTASHNPKRYTGAKLVGRGALALSGDAGIGDVRDRIAAGLGERARAAARWSDVDVYDEFQEAALQFIDAGRGQAAEGRRRRRQRDGGPDGRPAARATRARPDRGLLDARRQLPRPRAQPAAAREPRVHHGRGRQARAPTSGSPGTATPTAASSSTSSGAFVDGDFLTALLSESMIAKNPGATVLYDVRASRAVADTAARRGGQALMNRVGHAFFKTRMREEHAVFGGEVSGHYYFRDFYCADSGTIPALLILELLSTPGRDDVRAARALPLALLHLRRDQHRGRRSAGQDRASRRALQRRAPAPSSTGSRSTTTTGTSTSGRRTPSRCCACASSRCARPRTWAPSATRC